MKSSCNSNYFEFKLGELFCGPGGIALGAMKAVVPQMSVIHAWASDYDEDTCNTYRHNICPDAPESVFCQDVRTLDIDSLDPIDAFAFGFPCNDFSIIGKHKGFSGMYGQLYSYGEAVLRKYQPKWFLAENVGGLKSVGKGSALDKILNALKNCGYNIVPHYYKFEEYGIPQTRHRIIIVGIRNDIDLVFSVPKPTHIIDQFISCKEVIENPPIEIDAHNHKFTKQSKRVIERLRLIKPGQNIFQTKLPESLQLHIKGATFSQIYKRLDPNRPAYTITGSGGGGTHVYHWEENRALTNRERARLQTFPDNFWFSGGPEKIRKQIGMAVPPLAAQIIIEAILKTFAGIAYDSIPSNMRHYL